MYVLLTQPFLLSGGIVARIAFQLSKMLVPFTCSDVQLVCCVCSPAEWTCPAAGGTKPQSIHG